MVISLALLAAAAGSGTTKLTLVPNMRGLPGADVVRGLTDGIGAWALVAAMVGLVLGAVMWAFGHYSQNYQQAYNGRRGVLVSGLAALLIGGAPHIINFFTAAAKGFTH